MNALIDSAKGVQLDPQIVSVVYPEIVPGRVAHIDADFMAYQVSAEKKEELDGSKPRRSIEEMQHNAGEAADHLRRLTGAEHYICHITPSGSDKGGRGALAVQQEYQASRGDRDKPEHLDAIRGFIGESLNGAVHLNREADDGMSIANYTARANGTTDLSVIVSKDKDLRMCPGWHWDFDSEQLVAVDDPFGSIWIDASKTTKTLKGWGTKFFWAQCLMGDAADYIKGLPAVPGSIHTEFAPTTTYTKALGMVAKARKPELAVGPQKIINDQLNKTKPCGAVLAEKLLAPITNDRDAFNFVRRCWVELEENHGYEFRHWQTDIKVTATQALLGDMQLLWMRRNDDPMDCVHWLKEQMA